MSITFETALQSFKPRLPLAVALSGGADSTALLIACAARWPGQVQALHVHHGLQAAADGFEAHCRILCARLSVPLTVRHVDARHANGQSPEDAARQARYGALEGMLGEMPDIRSAALAQHADDQIETIVLALSRGAGVAGIAAMPMQWGRAGVDWHRPLLQTGGADIRRWLKEQGADWVEDPTNADERYTRNRIRKHVLPVLESVFPQFRDTFARSAEHAAQAAELLQELAVQDLQNLGNPPSIKALQGLSRARQANVLRHWLRLSHATTPSAAQLSALLDQVAACTTRGHRIHLKVGRGFIERKDGLLDWYN
ncbi:tRNA lysidine(34) synthetase TilS [Diaphorobacter sp. HDW4A]|uniref:tRNA lysidine(34) synthetase TilS n=1 Tax=Diaphorobacter sp. HDW4A TaxID=2714924 RepID=UPI00140C9B3C|nr:tRNA lysidine(34) synthetase TilS [Diaphorobacter sp. HDW4A]QIL79384.1 tRNA lysidine(34) synthetase TilS [Diaphorobacter sp. HDW4A]